MKLFEDTLYQLLAKQTAKYNEKDFIIFPDRGLRFTYTQFNDRVNQLAKGLLSIGIKKNDHIGIWATNVPDWLTFMFATARIGAVLVTVNTSYKTHELEYLVKQADLTTLCIVDGFKDSDYVKMVYDLIPELKTSQRGHLSTKKFPKLKNLVFIGPEKHRGMYSTAELILIGSHMDDSVLSAAEKGLDCHDTINMQYTSGTTGFPKGVMLSHYNILNNGYYIGECQKFTEAERLCLPVPLFHCFGIVLGVLAILTHGGALVVQENFDPLVVLASIQKEKCTALYGVPTMFIAELNHPMFDMFDLSSLRTGIMAGSPCPMEIMQDVINKMHCKDITIAYGLTEASPVITQTTVDDSIEARVSSVGKALSGIEVKIVDPDTGEDCPPDVQGEICCRGYNVMKGYYNLKDATEKVINKDNWLRSGDLGIKSEDGYFKVTGRIKDMIIRGGENIYPREIEEFLYKMDGILDVQIAAVPDEKYGEVVGAFIKRIKDIDISPEDVIDFCRGEIAKFKIPQHVFFVDDYPMTASGKIQKFKLGEMAKQWLTV